MFMSQTVLYFLHISSVLSFYIDVVLKIIRTYSIKYFVDENVENQGIQNRSTGNTQDKAFSNTSGIGFLPARCLRLLW